MRHVHCCTLLCAQGAGCAASACARRAALATRLLQHSGAHYLMQDGLGSRNTGAPWSGAWPSLQSKPCAAGPHGRHRFRTTGFAAASRFRSLRLGFGPRRGGPHREVLSSLRFVAGYVAALLNALARSRLQSSGRNARVLRATAATGAQCQLARESVLPELATPTWQLHRWRGGCASDTWVLTSRLLGLVA